MSKWDWERFVNPSAIDNESIVYMLEQGLGRVKQGWCQLQAAFDRDGDFAYPDSPDAVCWCVTGALLSLHPDDYLFANRSQYMVEMWKLCFEILAIPLTKPQDVHPAEWTPQGQLEGWNDTEGRTVEDVVELYETALIFARNPPPPKPPPPATVIMGAVIPTTTDWMARWTEAMRAYAQGEELPEGFEGVPYWMGF